MKKKKCILSLKLIEWGKTFNSQADWAARQSYAQIAWPSCTYSPPHKVLQVANYIRVEEKGRGGQANSINKRKSRSHKYFQDYKSNSDTECVERGLKFGEVKAR